MKTIFALFLLWVPVLLAQSAAPQSSAAGPTARHVELAQRYVITTGQSFETCLQAVMTWEWCAAHPQGGTVNGVYYDAAATAQQLAMAKRALMTPEQLRQAQSQAVRGGALSTRPATPSGRSANDPQRIAEQMARQQRQQGGQQAGGVADVIATAIERRQMLQISYNDGAAGARLIEPYLLGVTTAGNPALQAWFVSGASASGQGPGWRTFLLAQITGIELVNETFTPRRDYDGTGGGTFQRYVRRVE